MYRDGESGKLSTSTAGNVASKWLSQDLNSQMSSSKICTGLERWWETKEKKKWKEREVGERKMMKKIDRDLSIMTISAFLPVRKPFFPKSRILCTPLFHGSQTIKGWGDFRDGKMNIQRKCDLSSSRHEGQRWERFQSCCACTTCGFCASFYMLPHRILTCPSFAVPIQHKEARFQNVN